MAKIEVEHRGHLTQKQFRELSKFLKKNGKFLGEKDRFSVIYFAHGEKENFNLNQDNPIDLRVRITNKKTELVLKYGKWGGRDTRKEFIFSVGYEKFEELVEFLHILGFYYGGLQATNTRVYVYKNVEIALVKVPNWGYYFEAEIVTNPRLVKADDKKIISVCKELGLSVLNDEEFCKLCESLNNRPGFRFNFKKQKFSDIKKRFIDYF